VPPGNSDSTLFVWGRTIHDAPSKVTLSIPRIFAKWKIVLGQQSRLRLFPAAFPSLIATPQKRRLSGQMRQLDHYLPDLLAAALPLAMKSPVDKIDAHGPSLKEEWGIRAMADLTIMLNRHPQLGFCLGRSLVRWTYLRQTGLPVVVHFGARIIKGKPDREITDESGLRWIKNLTSNRPRIGVT
jgi:hypothetical protein